VVFGNYAKTTGRTGRVVAVVMMVVPVDTVCPPAEAGRSSWTWAAVMTMGQENYAAALLVKCCGAKDRGT